MLTTKQRTKKISYLDLKVNDRLRFSPVSMELEVERITDGDLTFKVFTMFEGREIRLKSGSYMPIGDIIIHNLGRRGYGNRCHMELAYPSNYSYTRY